MKNNSIKQDMEIYGDLLNLKTVLMMNRYVISWRITENQAVAKSYFFRLD